ncbi:sugar phosphate nucleotidyltransferase [Thiothrix winogradskyi]|uniref:NDP-sugar synthase n=1 Tax=Thiothrix winogradskyi TaxID=96472 RepID=A0ABY3SZ18_9GAMM|nr:NDP-sugar synthase [Thiothrix winogradskyi]UJS23700.1 NDP-sugar synthase [Thiothrix winogradskyi]
MKAMILAAGKGTRVRPITNEMPKPMIPILRKPVMESIVELLRAHSVREIVVNTSHLAPVIENYFRDGNQLGVHIAYSYEGYMTEDGLEGKALGSAGGMKRIQEFSGFFDETFIVLCGDAWIDLDISAALRWHKEKGGIATIILQEVPHEEVHKYGVVKLDEHQRIVQFQEKPKSEEAVSNTINTGIYIFEPDIFQYIPAGIEYDIGGQLFPALVAAGEEFYGLPMDFQWVDIGSVPDVWAATRMALQGKIKGFRMPGKQVKPGVWTGINVSINWDRVKIKPPVYIGSSSKIEAGAEITGPCMIGANCVIESGAEISECLISDYTRIGGMASLDNKLVFGGDCISPDGNVLNLGETQIRWLVDDMRRALNPSDIHDMLLFSNMLIFHEVQAWEKEAA